MLKIITLDLRMFALSVSVFLSLRVYKVCGFSFLSCLVGGVSVQGLRASYEAWGDAGESGGPDYGLLQSLCQ